MEVEFYCSETGKSYVGDAIEELSPKSVKKIKYALDRLERYGAHTLLRTSDLCIQLKGYTGLYELRVKSEKIFYRIIFTIRENTCWLLHFFKKKSNITPRKEIAIALSRRRLLEIRY